MHRVYLSIGSNLGNKKAHITSAVDLCRASFGACELSAFYESEAWGYHSDNTYINGAILLHTDKAPQELWTVVSGIEDTLGRVRKGQGYQDRPIDLDIILIDQVVIEGDLIVPHPRMHLRDFVLKPLVDLGDPLHPIFQKKASTLLKELKQTSILRTVEL